MVRITSLVILALLGLAVGQDETTVSADYEGDYLYDNKDLELPSYTDTSETGAPASTDTTDYDLIASNVGGPVEYDDYSYNDLDDKTDAPEVPILNMVPKPNPSPVERNPVFTTAINAGSGPTFNATAVSAVAVPGAPVPAAAVPPLPACDWQPIKNGIKRFPSFTYNLMKRSTFRRRHGISQFGGSRGGNVVQQSNSRNNGGGRGNSGVMGGRGGMGGMGMGGGSFGSMFSSWMSRFGSGGRSGSGSGSGRNSLYGWGVNRNNNGWGSSSGGGRNTNGAMTNNGNGGGGRNNNSGSGGRNNNNSGSGGRNNNNSGVRNPISNAGGMNGNSGRNTNNSGGGRNNNAGGGSGRNNNGGRPEVANSNNGSGRNNGNGGNSGRNNNNGNGGNSGGRNNGNGNNSGRNDGGNSPNADLTAGGKTNHTQGAMSNPGRGPSGRGRGNYRESMASSCPNRNCQLNQMSPSRTSMWATVCSLPTPSAGKIKA